MGPSCGFGLNFGVIKISGVGANLPGAAHSLGIIYGPAQARIVPHANSPPIKAGLDYWIRAHDVGWADQLYPAFVIGVKSDLLHFVRQQRPSEVIHGHHSDVVHAGRLSDVFRQQPRVDTYIVYSGYQPLFHPFPPGGLDPCQSFGPQANPRMIDIKAAFPRRKCRLTAAQSFNSA